MPFYGSDDDYGYDYVNSELFRARSNTSKTMFSIRGGEVSAVQPGRVYHEKLRRGNLSARPVRVDDPAPIWTTIPEKYIGYKIAPDGYHYDDSEEHLYKRRRQPIYRDAERRRTIYREQAWSDQQRSSRPTYRDMGQQPEKSLSPPAAGSSRHRNEPDFYRPVNTVYERNNRSPVQSSRSIQANIPIKRDSSVQADTLDTEPTKPIQPRRLIRPMTASEEYALVPRRSMSLLPRSPSADLGLTQPVFNQHFLPPISAPLYEDELLPPPVYYANTHLALQPSYLAPPTTTSLPFYNPYEMPVTSPYSYDLAYY